MDAAGLLAAKTLRETATTIDTGGGRVEVKLRALPRRVYRELVDAHPPGDGDPAKDWDSNTFPPALIAASLTDPVFTLEQAHQLWDEWETSESARLFLACYHLNESPELLGFIMPGSVSTNGSGRNSTTASRKASPTRSSSTGKKPTKPKRSPGS